MFGAIIGDIVGSPYEFDSNNVKTKDFPLFTEKSHFTDDSVMTLAVAKAVMDTQDKESNEELKLCFVQSMRELGAAYPDAGYGGRFSYWLTSDAPKPYNSYGNGSAMRVSAVAWMFESVSEVRRVARLSAEVTHNHPEGIKGAEATASAVFMARTGHGKAEIRHYIESEFGYDFSRTCDEIRPGYRHVESCQETVPEALTAFFEGESFEDVLRLAVSLGGDSDTLTAIAGSIAEAYYGIDEDWKKAAFAHLPDDLAQILRRFDVIYGINPQYQINPLHEAVLFAEKAHRGQKRKGTDIDYITHPMEVFQILTSMNAGYELLVAGLLHDTVEDTDVTIDDIRKAFGERVATLVGNHSEDKSKTWKERKQHTIDELKTADRDTKLLIMADKVSNLRSMLSDYAQVGEKLWERFNASKELQSWYNSEVQDALYDLQFDDNARLVYWELVALYKDLFVEYYADTDNRMLYQAACGMQTFIFYHEDGMWEPFEGDLPDNVVRIPRLKAERLEDLWRQDFHDFTLDGNECIEYAIADYYAGQTDEYMMVVLQKIWERLQQDGHMIFPVEQMTDIADGEEVVERFKLRTIELKNGDEAAAAFTSHAAMRRAPKTAILSFFIDNTLEAVYKNEGLAGLMINPWGDAFFLSKPMIRMILDQKKATVGKENAVTIQRCDITELECDCIVNAAKKTLLGGGGVDGAIHAAAGRGLLEECRALHGCETGEAKITGGYNLPAKYVIHTVGPIYSGADQDAMLLANCYRNSLTLAKEHDIHSIAFPAISTGIYGYPLRAATQIAIDTVCQWLYENPYYGMEVIFACYDKQTYDVYHELYMKTLE